MTDSNIAVTTDVFANPAALRLSQDFTALVGVKRKLLTVPVRKPERTEFVRVHPGEDYRATMAVLELKAERETYLVTPQLYAQLAGGESAVAPRLICTAVTRQGVVFLWPARLPGLDGKFDAWGQSMLEAVELAKTKWVRVASSMALGAYDVFEPTGTLPEPAWGEERFSDLLRVGFQGKVIDSPDHPVLRKLRGEV
jgi:hypothetical protein